MALGMASVALPLLALHAGYSKSSVGLLTAASAVSQMGVRMVLGLVMRRYPDWVLGEPHRRRLAWPGQLLHPGGAGARRPAGAGDRCAGVGRQRRQHRRRGAGG